MVIDVDRAHTCWCASVENIARLQREELGDIGDNLINTIKHVAGAAFLHRFAIDIQMEMNSLYIKELFLWHPFANGSRTIKTLADGPRLSCLRGFLLQIASRKVDANSQSIVIPMGKALWDILA